MKRIQEILLGLLTVTMCWGAAGVQAQPSSEQVLPLRPERVDGSSNAVLQAGTYRVLGVVGQAVVGNRSGRIWPLYRQRQAIQEAGLLEEAQEEVPAAFALGANYPNPFNPETTIRFALPEASHVRIEVFDVLGRRVARVVDGSLEAGRHEVVFDGSTLSSGIYVYRMTSDTFEQHRTMILLK